jgi:hypothetical protein
LLSNEGGGEPKGQHPAILVAKLCAVHAGGELGCEIRSLGTIFFLIPPGFGIS